MSMRYVTRININNTMYLLCKERRNYLRQFQQVHVYYFVADRCNEAFDNHHYVSFIFTCL